MAKNTKPPAPAPSLSLDPDYTQPAAGEETQDATPGLARDEGQLAAFLSSQEAGQENMDNPPPPVVAKPELAPPQRQGDDTRPFCSRHNCLMRSTSSTSDITRYSCPVPTCDQKEKRARRAVQIPREPQVCPDIRCREKASFLESDPKRSSTAHLSMVCPKCGYEIKVPRPMYLGLQRTYEHDGDLAAR
jgi:hypothetical protein